MHLLVILYESRLSREQVEELFRARAKRYTRVAGLLQKLYVRDPATGQVGGIYMFDSALHLRQFLASNPDEKIRQVYAVREPLSMRTLEVLMLLYPERDRLWSPPAPRVHRL